MSAKVRIRDSVPSDVLDRAGRAAARLGHRDIGAEHLVLAMLEPDTACAEALCACGLQREDFEAAICSLPGSYRRGMSHETPGPQRVLPETLEVIARAEGLAAGLGVSGVEDEHVLIAVLLEPGSLVVLTLLGRLGVV